MRKFKLLSTLFVSVLSMSALAACTTPTQADIDAILPAPTSIQRDGVNIESITFENVPDKIEIGCFDDYGIELKIVYSDGYIETYPLTIDKFPDNLKHALNEIGSHTITIAFRGHTTSYVFNIVEGSQSFFLIRYFSYDGRVIHREEVHYKEDDHLKNDPPEGPTRAKDALFSYNFLEWDTELTKGQIINKSYDIYPLYKKVQKRYDVTKPVVPTVEGKKLQLLHKNTSGAYYGAYAAFVYLGRVDRVPLIYSDAEDPNSVEYLEGNLYFDSEGNDDNKPTLTRNVVNELYSKCVNVDTSNYNDYFADVGISTPVVPEFYSGEYFDIAQDTAGETLVLFEGDTSYSQIYRNNIYNFVDSHDENHKTPYLVNAASDLKSGNVAYRASIETSVDVVVKVNYYAHSEKYEIQYYTYYFLMDLESTYQVVEYSDSTSFNTTGNILSYNMADLKAVLKNVVEG